MGTTRLRTPHTHTNTHTHTHTHKHTTPTTHSARPHTHTLTKHGQPLELDHKAGSLRDNGLQAKGRCPEHHGGQAQHNFEGYTSAIKHKRGHRTVARHAAAPGRDPLPDRAAAVTWEICLCVILLIS